jgi:predicted dinucleotide-binding enzyme
MQIAVLGAGSVGGALGKRLAAAGHSVYFGVRNPADDKVSQLVAEIGPTAQAGTVAEAARAAQVIILATPWPAASGALQACGDVTGKLIVDCTNPLRMGAAGLELTLGYDTSGAEQLAALVPGAHVVKAFNQTGFGNMAEPVYDGKASVMFICGDDAASRATVVELSKDIGFDTVDAGQLNVARLLEPLALLWIHLAYNAGMQRDFAFALLRR